MTATDSSGNRLIDPQPEVFVLLVCYKALVSTCLPTFRNNVWVSSWSKGKYVIPNRRSTYATPNSRRAKAVPRRMSETPHDSQVISTLYICRARAVYLTIKANISQVRCAQGKSSGAFTSSSSIISKTFKTYKMWDGGRADTKCLK